jgi:hypothetical protein
VRVLTDMARSEPAHRESVQKMLAEALPIADRVLDPPWAQSEEDWEMFGVSKAETHAFAAQCLSRRLKVIGLAA